MARHRFIEATLRGFTEALSRTLASEQIAKQKGLLQSLDPRVRLIGLLVLIIASTVVRKLPVLLALFVLSLLLTQASRINVGLLVKRVWLVAFFFTGLIALPAIFFTAGTTAFQIGLLTGTEQGLRTAALLLLRAETAVTLSAALILTTSWSHLLKAMRLLGVPAELVTMMAMSHRYIFLFMETASQMFLARESRILGSLDGLQQRGLASRTAGVLLSKSIDTSEEVYLAMQSRGFRGEVELLTSFRFAPIDYAALACCLLITISVIWIGR